MILNEIKNSIKILLIFTIICGIIYPLIITGISQLLFKDIDLMRSGTLYESEYK